MTTNADIDHILSSYSDYPELTEYLSKLKDYRNGVKKSMREQFVEQRKEKEEHKLKRPANRRGLINWVNSSEELNNLSHEQRRSTILNMAMIHYEQEIKDGHVKNNIKTKEFRHHPIPEIDSYIFKKNFSSKLLGYIKPDFDEGNHISYIEN